MGGEAAVFVHVDLMVGKDNKVFKINFISPLGAPVTLDSVTPVCFTGEFTF